MVTAKGDEVTVGNEDANIVTDEEANTVTDEVSIQTGSAKTKSVSDDANMETYEEANAEGSSFMQTDSKKTKKYDGFDGFRSPVPFNQNGNVDSFDWKKQMHLDALSHNRDDYSAADIDAIIAQCEMLGYADRIAEEMKGQSCASCKVGQTERQAQPIEIVKKKKRKSKFKGQS